MAARAADTPAPNCRRCPRLAALRRRVRREYPDYHAAPVAAVGPSDARLLVVGLAPGMHGANASGRPFSGDDSGALLFETLHRHGFANQPFSRGPGDGLVLTDCRITNAVKCLPPANRPTAEELATCARFLSVEVARPEVIVALGAVAHRALVRLFGQRQRDHVFGHRAIHALPDAPLVIDSYHCSRYNLNTRRLTPAMFDAVFDEARRRLSSPRILSSRESGASWAG